MILQQPIADVDAQEAARLWEHPMARRYLARVLTMNARLLAFDGSWGNSHTFRHTKSDVQYDVYIDGTVVQR